MSRKTRNVKEDEAAELLGITLEDFKELVDAGILSQAKGAADGFYTWPSIKREYVEHQKDLEAQEEKNKKKTPPDDKYEWIKATTVAARLKSEGYEVSKFAIGKYAKEGLLTRDEENKTYPWPKTLDEYKQALMSKQNYSARVSDAEINISDDDVTDVFTTEKLIKMIEEGVKGADTKAYQWARALNEIIKARQGQLKLKEAENKTLDIADVEKWVGNISRQNKQFWLNWVGRISVKMAEELEVDSRVLNSILGKYVRQNLERIATLPDGYESEVVESS